MTGTRDSAERAARSLLSYCIREKWIGWDPYDGLNSRVFGALPLSRSRIFRLLLTQGMKRSPLNLRPLLLVPKEENPKACALFCTSLLLLSKCGIHHDQSLVAARLKRLLELRSKGYPHYCWGYSFDWQSRGLFLPKYQPNIICTVFAGNALLDAYERYQNEEYLEAGKSAAEFLLTGLNVIREHDGLCLSYTPRDTEQVHNANFLGAAFLGRLSSITGNGRFRDVAEQAMRFSLRRQRDDGSWPYGEEKTQGWIDNFHTGFNLVALWKLFAVLGDRTLKDAIIRGLRFYMDHFFADGAIPKYYHDKVWPVDIHSVAQSIITLCELTTLHAGATRLATEVCQWALDNLRSDEGYFYFQKTRWFTNRIPYMRWSQAWMLYGLSVFLNSTAVNRRAT
jgi:rhamnogalacturonyl hydrolase YesR